MALNPAMLPLSPLRRTISRGYSLSALQAVEKRRLVLVVLVLALACSAMTLCYSARRQEASTRTLSPTRFLLVLELLTSGRHLPFCVHFQRTTGRNASVLLSRFMLEVVGFRHPFACFSSPLWQTQHKAVRSR